MGEEKARAQKQKESEKEEMRHRLIGLINQLRIRHEISLTDNDTKTLINSLLANGVIVPPCKEGDTVYQIKKFCDENIGYKEFYRPNKEFDKPCPHYQAAEWEIGERCTACEDYEDSHYCSLNLDIHCEMCKERMAIQKDTFNFSMMHRIFNTPMFNENTELSDILYLTKEEAETALERSGE